MNCIINAIYNELEYVIIFEDDAYPCKDVILEFSRCIDDLDKNGIEWGCLSLGRNGEASGWNEFPGYSFHKQLTDESKKFHSEDGFRTNIEEVTENIIRIPKYPFGSHAYLVKNSYFDYAISRFSKYLEPSDLNLCYPKLKTFFTKKCLFI